MNLVALDFKTIALLMVALVWCGMLLVIRTLWTWSFDYAFLVWNLGLAAAPMFFSTLVILQRRLSLRLFFGLFWLLFLPNAPYIITDFIHLRTLASGPIWLDVLLLSSCAATGLALGYCSTMQIHRLFIVAGRPLLGWLLAVTAMFLSGLGIYLGRFLRWRSIDIARDPFLLLSDIAERLVNPFVHYRAWAVTLGFGVMLSIGYAFLMLRSERGTTTDAAPTALPDHSAKVEAP